MDRKIKIAPIKIPEIDLNTINNKTNANTILSAPSSSTASIITALTGVSESSNGKAKSTTNQSTFFSQCTTHKIIYGIGAVFGVVFTVLIIWFISE